MTDEQHRILAAAMARILPSEHGPGATEANTVGYAEWLTSHFPPVAESLATGLELLESLATGMWGKSFASCRALEQDAVLERIQKTPHPTAQRFFGTLVRITLAGFLSAPRYGGNRDGIGWKYIGFTPHPLTCGSTEIHG